MLLRVYKVTKVTSRGWDCLDGKGNTLTIKKEKLTALLGVTQTTCTSGHHPVSVWHTKHPHER